MKTVNHREFGIDYPVVETIQSPVLVLGNGDQLHRDVGRSLRTAGWPVAIVRPTGCAAAHASSISDKALDAAIAQALGTLEQRPGHAVVMLGGDFRPGRLLDGVDGQLQQALDENVRPHLLAARALLPVLAANDAPSTYLVLGGPAAESPWCGYGCQSVASATLRSMTQVLRDEMSATRVRVRQLSVCTPTRCDSNRDNACVVWPNTLEVGHRIADLLDSPGQDTVIRLTRSSSGKALPA